MKHKDEEIIMQRKAATLAQVEETAKEAMEMEKQESIFEDLVHLEGMEVKFFRRVIEEFGLSFYMPESFELLDDEMKKTFYPFGNPPRNVYSDFDIPFQITLNKTDNIVPDDGIPKLMQMSAKILENYGPKSKILSNGVIRHEEHNIGIMEVGTRAVDCNVHNVMFYISIENRVVIGNINFATKYSKRMIPIAKQIIDSIEFIREENDGNNNTSKS